MKRTKRKIAGRDYFALALMLLTLGLWGALWHSHRHPHENDELSGASTNVLPPSAGGSPHQMDELKDAREDILKLTQLVMRDELGQARELARELASVYTTKQIMRMFRRPDRGGLGIGAELAAITNLEIVVGPPDRCLTWHRSHKTTTAAAWQTAAIAEFLRAKYPIVTPANEIPVGTFTREFRSGAYALVDAMKDDEKARVSSAAEKLKQACIQCHTELKTLPPPSYTVPPRSTEPTLPNLMAMARNVGVDSYERAQALRALAGRQTEAKKIIPALIDALLDESPVIQDETIAALKALGGSDLTGHPEMDQALKTERPALRWWVAYQLRHSQTPLLGINEILKKNSDFDVRFAALRILPLLDADSGRSALIQALKDADPIVRGRAVMALSRMGKAVVPELRLVLKKSRREVRSSAINALGRIGPDAGEAVPDLKCLLKDDDELIRKLAAIALGKIEAK